MVYGNAVLLTVRILQDISTHANSRGTEMLLGVFLLSSCEYGALSAGWVQLFFMKVYFSLFSVDICLFLGLITMIANWPEILFCVFFVVVVTEL